MLFYYFAMNKTPLLLTTFLKALESCLPPLEARDYINYRKRFQIGRAWLTHCLQIRDNLSINVATIYLVTNQYFMRLHIAYQLKNITY